MFPLIIQLTDRNGDQFYMNAQRITTISTDPDSAGALIYVDASDDEFVVLENKITVCTRIQQAIADQRVILATTFAHYMRDAI